VTLNRKRVLVTGADGFIGSHLTEGLVRAGTEVRAFVLYNSFNSWGWLDHCAPDVKGYFDVFAGDIRDPHGVRTAMKDCDAVLHLAALIAIPYSYHSPDTYVDTNVKGTLNVVQAARELEVSRVVHTSTSEVYGTARFVPMTEEHPLQGQSPYSASKIGADQIAMSFHASFGTPVVVIRPFNTYGPRQSARAVIPSIIAQIASGQRAIRLGAVHPTRDFSFVSDTVTGFMRALQAEHVVGEVINLGSGFEISIGGAARAIADVMGATIEVVQDEQRLRPEKSEVDRLLASNDKARRLLNWSPHFGGAEGFTRPDRRMVRGSGQSRALQGGRVQPMNRRAVILAGGMGTRMRPYTLVLPKPLMPIGEYPILEVVVRQLAAHDFDRVTIAVNHQAELIKAFFGDGSKWRLRIDYSLEHEPLGTMGPLRLIPDLPDHFLVMNGDVLTDLDFAAFHAEHAAANRLFTISSHQREQKVDYGVLSTDAHGTLQAFQEKPVTGYEVSMGIYMVSSKILSYIPSHGPFGFDDLMRDLLAKRTAVHVRRFNGYWLDIGRVDDYERAIDEFPGLKHRFLNE